ncbi:MAG: DUF1844 domain-containing protein [Armatimonadota bacterium]
MSSNENAKDDDEQTRTSEIRTAAEIAEERARQRAAEAAASEEAAAAEPAAEEAEPESEPGQEKGPEETAQAPQVVTVQDLVKGTIELLSAQAWQRLGLMVDPQTKQIEKDVEQARLAIDCVEALLKQLDAHLSDDERRTFEGVLTNLKVNFVRQSSG